MGVRLYPNTQDHRKLEQLAGVPAGTADMLLALEKSFGVDSESERQRAANWDSMTQEQRQTVFRDNEQRSESFYTTLFADGVEAVHNYHSFLLYGWGKFRDPEDLAPGYCGRITDPAIAQRLLNSNGIKADAVLCDGVHWS